MFYGLNTRPDIVNVHNLPVQKTMKRKCSSNRGPCRGELPFSKNTGELQDGTSDTVWKFVYEDDGPPDDGETYVECIVTHKGDRYVWVE